MKHLHQLQQWWQTSDPQKWSLLEVDLLMKEMQKQYEVLAVRRADIVTSLRESIPQNSLQEKTVPLKNASDSKDAIGRPSEKTEMVPQEKKAAAVSEIVIDNTDILATLQETLQPLEATEVLPPEEVQAIKQETSEAADDAFIVEHSLKRKPEDDFLWAFGLKKQKPFNHKEIRKYIGLNDQLHYLHVLFAGSTEKYNAALDEINRLDNAEDARKLIKKLVVHQEAHQEEQEKAMQILFAAIAQIMT